MEERESQVLSSILKPLASLRLTVVLFAMAMFIVMGGTLAQVDKGIWTVVGQYFRCFFAWVDLGVFFPRRWAVPGGFYFPGGWLIGSALAVNLLAAHAIRFKVRARGLRLGLGLVVLAAGGVLIVMILRDVFSQEVAATEGAAFWRVLRRLALGGGVAIILLAGCALLFRKRAGIVMIHGGILMLLASELITGLHSVESNMTLRRGEVVNYVTLNRVVELAIIDHSDPESDQVTVVPMSQITQPGVIRNDELPFDIEVLKYMKNCDLRSAAQVGGGQKNPATAGSGLRVVAIEEPEASGVDTNQRINGPAAYIKLTRKGRAESLGTYLVTVWLPTSRIPAQTVTVGDKTYEIAMRFERIYKPYSLELLEFRHDKYVGTQTPKNFSAKVRLVDKSRGVDRVVKIWMNNPLRYAGETFYQASFRPGQDLTILQVVRNDGWMLPYLACMIVGLGMTVHFGTLLIGFLRRRASA